MQPNVEIPDKILITQTAGFGDHVLASALVETIAAHRPDTVIDVLIRKGNESVFAGNPHVRRILVWDKESGKYKNLFRLFQEVRNQRYDLVLNLHRFLSLGLLTLFSGARMTVGFDRSPVSRFFTRRVKYGFRYNNGSILHAIERNHRLLEGLVPGGPFKPKLYPSEEDLRRVEAYKKQPFICIGVAASRFTNTFPQSQWRDLVTAIPEHFLVYLLGDSTDISRCNWIRDQSGRKGVFNLAGELTLVQSAALMRDAVINYTCDSAALHLASAMNAPTATVFCSTTTANGFGPLSDIHFIIESPEALDCRPCTSHGRSKCKRGDLACATTITTVHLLEALAEVEARGGSTSEIRQNITVLPISSPYPSEHRR